MPNTKIPDRYARKQTEDIDEPLDEAGELEGRQVSAKSGKHSSAMKEAASRPEYAPKAKPVPGAHGDPAGVAPGRGIPRSKTKGAKH